MFENPIHFISMDPKRILYISIGSRGDMEPFLASGEVASQAGHTVAFCFPAQFESLAKEVSPHFYPETAAFLQLLELPEVRNVMGQVGNAWSRILNILKISKQIQPIQEQLILDQEAAVAAFNPDQIVFHIKCIYPILWHLNTGNSISLLSPMPCTMHPVEDEPHIGFGKPRSRIWNRFTYILAEWALIHKSILGYGRAFIKMRNLRIAAADIKSLIRERLPVHYAIDTRLFSRPAYWPSQAQIIGFKERNKRKFYQEDPQLMQFLQKFPKPIFVTFGSMVNAQPHQIGSDLVEISQKHQIPMLVNTSWGGIQFTEPIPESMYVVKDLPYDYILPKTGGIVHHGGSGTTHSALECGIPQAIIPHIGDQFFWNRCIGKTGYGITGFPIKQWSKVRFETLLLQLRALK